MPNMHPGLAAKRLQLRRQDLTCATHSCLDLPGSRLASKQAYHRQPRLKKGFRYGPWL